MTYAAVVPSAVAVLSTSGCVRETNLEPAPAATVIEEDTAIAREAGVTVVAEVDAWQGDPGVLDHVTPVRVSLRNESDRPVRVQYRLFSLQGPEGRRFAALPPFLIEGSVREPVLVGGYGAFGPEFGYRGFGVDPLYAGVWTGVDPVGAGLYDYDLGYYDEYYAYWRRPLPTPQMIRRVLPEGVLEPGGEVSGFLYFQKVSGDVPRVSFQARLVNARSGRLFGMARIPFRVEG